ncbi:MAG: hypothetical protein KIT82_05255 [Bradyrhizobium sp.]|nr:hypothetical protein [Bradyrhizobium sp.]
MYGVVVELVVPYGEGDRSAKLIGDVNLVVCAPRERRIASAETGAPWLSPCDFCTAA